MTQTWIVMGGEVRVELLWYVRAEGMTMSFGE